LGGWRVGLLEGGGLEGWRVGELEDWVGSASLRVRGLEGWRISGVGGCVVRWFGFWMVARLRGLGGWVVG
jgi:hypothetical protein